jgi:heat shock protein HslJ
MKKLFILISITFFLPSLGAAGSGLFAQDPELFNHTWYLQKIVLEDGTEHTPIPNDDVPFITIIFNDEIPYYFETSVCNTFFGSLIYNSNQSLTIQESAMTLIDCKPVENYSFEGIQFGFFLDNNNNHIEDPFPYNITTAGNGDKTLTIINVRGDEAIYGNLLLSTGQYDSVQFQLYPNPVQETLQINQNIYQFVTATIYNLQGKKIYRHTLENSHSTIDVKTLNSGLYFLVLESETGERVAQKFVKQ